MNVACPSCHSMNRIPEGRPPWPRGAPMGSDGRPPETPARGDSLEAKKHDRHRLEAHTDMRIVCVFTPALVGRETHDEDGSYPILDD